MKTLRLLPALAAMIVSLTACAIHVPWEVLGDYDGVRVVLRVTPDDADVLLNGRFIGAAYEYASPAAALRLASRANELTLRKKGFVEQVLDLGDYPSRRITVKTELKPAAPGSPAATAAADGSDPAYQATSEPLPPLPEERPAPAAERFLTGIELALSPEETALYIDGRFWGLAPAQGKALFLRLPPGKYAFAAFKPGYAPFSKEISIPKQEKFTLAIDLQK